jgi:hypothetical protein
MSKKERKKSGRNVGPCKKLPANVHILFFSVDRSAF